MVMYRRNRVAGGTYFFTVALADRRSDLLTAHVDLLRQAFREARRRRPFTVEAIVVLPEHLHTIWTLPAGDGDFAVRWSHLKSHFSRAVAKRVELEPSVRGEFSAWQRRYWEHTIRNEEDFASHCDYIHYNPVKHGYVASPGDWTWSSFGRFVERGAYGIDWGTSEPGTPLKTGEPL